MIFQIEPPALFIVQRELSTFIVPSDSGPTGPFSHVPLGPGTEAPSDLLDLFVLDVGQVA